MLTRNFRIVKESQIVNSVRFRNPRGRHFAMPPSKKQKVPAPASRSAAKSRAGGTAGHEQPEVQPRGLNQEAVKEFLEMIQRHDRLGPDFFSDDEKQQWDEWWDATPASAAESADGISLFPIMMPAKCLPRTAAPGSSAGPSSSQQEIIVYRNAGGRQFGVADRQRQRAQTKHLLPANVPVGSSVAIRRVSASSDTQRGPPGYNTHFYIGEVVSISPVDASGHVRELQVHFRMPQGGDGLFCDDSMTKPWNLACHALHTYHKSCERGKACKAAAKKASSETSRLTYKCHVGEIFETQLAFNQSGTLKAETKKRLVGSAPEDQKGAWNEQLGLVPKL